MTPVWPPNSGTCSLVTFRVSPHLFLFGILAVHKSRKHVWKSVTEYLPCAGHHALKAEGALGGRAGAPTRSWSAPRPLAQVADIHTQHTSFAYISLAGESPSKTVTN